jgi:integrase
MAKKLTDISIAKIKPHPTKRLEIPDAGKPGLYLVLQPTGKKSWAVRYRRQSDGKPRKLTFTGFPSLAMAHKLAQEALDKIANGGDPANEKRAARGSHTSDIFGDIASDFLKRHIVPNASSTYSYETQRLLNKDVLPRWGHRPIHEIDKRDVIELLDEIIDRGGGLTANRTLAAIRKLFNWAISRGILSTSPIQGIKAPLAERTRDRVLEDEEVHRLWVACQTLGYPFGPMVQLLLLTGQRRTEVAGIRWSEIDLDKAEWTIPGTRTKNSEPHSVPLSDMVIGIIKSLPYIQSNQGFLFTTTGETHVTGYSRAKADLDKLMADEGDDLPHWTFHDLRRTTASGMARLGINLPVIEKVLNHTSGSFAGIVGVYQRHHFSDEKRNALEAWARFVQSLLTPTENVVSLRAGRT